MNPRPSGYEPDSGRCADLGKPAKPLVRAGFWFSWFRVPPPPIAPSRAMDARWIDRDHTANATLAFRTPPSQCHPPCHLPSGSLRTPPPRLTRSGPRGEQHEPFSGGRSGLGRVNGEGEAGSAAISSPSKARGELADYAVVEGLGTSSVVADVVCTPSTAELVAAGGQLADQVVKLLVVRISTRFGAQDRDGHVGEHVPVRVEVVGRLIEEGAFWV